MFGLLHPTHQGGRASQGTELPASPRAGSALILGGFSHSSAPGAFQLLCLMYFLNTHVYTHTQTQQMVQEKQ